MTPFVLCPFNLFSFLFLRGWLCPCFLFLRGGLCLRTMFDPSKEAWYFMRTAQTFKQEEITEESMKLKGKAKVDQGLQDALCDAESGVLRAGVLPQLSAATPQGSKKLVDALQKA